MRFSHLFILLLMYWPRWSRTSWFGLRTSLTFWSLTFYFSICWPLTSCLCLYIPWPPWAFGGNVTSWHPRSSHALLRSRHIPVSCKADTYQYPLQSRHLLVSYMKPIPTSTFAKPTPTSTHYKAIIYRYTMVRDDSFSIVQDANFSIVRGAVFSIIRGAVFSIVRGDAFSVVRSGAFVEMLHRLLGPWWRCSPDRSEVLGEAWVWWRLCGELNSWLREIARMRLCAVSGDQVR